MTLNMFFIDWVCSRVIFYDFEHVFVDWFTFQLNNKIKLLISYIFHVPDLLDEIRNRNKETVIEVINDSPYRINDVNKYGDSLYHKELTSTTTINC